MQPVKERYGTVTASSRLTTFAMSATTPGASSCLYTSPRWGLASMMMPALAPFFPASHEPCVVISVPWSYVLVSSPKYQTFPCLSCAYQSNVSSITEPSAILTTSWTTVIGTVRIVFLSRVTSTVLNSSPSLRMLWYVKTLPGGSGKYGLVTPPTKLFASNGMVIRLDVAVIDAPPDDGAVDSASFPSCPHAAM